MVETVKIPDFHSGGCGFDSRARLQKYFRRDSKTLKEELYNLTTNVQHSIFANKLRAFRVRKGLSIPCAASHSGVDSGTIYDYENDRATPKM